MKSWRPHVVVDAHPSHPYPITSLPCDTLLHVEPDLPMTNPRPFPSCLASSLLLDGSLSRLSAALRPLSASSAASSLLSSLTNLSLPFEPASKYLCDSKPPTTPLSHASSDPSLESSAIILQTASKNKGRSGASPLVAGDRLRVSHGRRPTTGPT